MQEYSIKRGFKDGLADRAKDGLVKYFDTEPEVKGGHFSISFGSFTLLEAWINDKGNMFVVDTVSDAKLYETHSEEEADKIVLDTNKRFRGYLEYVTGYNVDRYAEAYEKLEEFNAKFPEEMKKSILQYAIEGRLVEQRAEEGTAEELYKQIQSEKQKLIKEGKIKKEKPLPEITSAKEDSNWRRVLKYFSSATQIGMTATPKESADVSNIDYFGDPVYVYSLKQGIDDGFLAPFKVINVTLDISDGWRPYKGQKDIFGNEIEDRIYNNRDYDYPKGVIIKDRICADTC